MSQPYVLGIDIGGTNLKALAVGKNGQDLGEWHTPTGDDGSSSWLDNVAQLLRLIAEEIGGSPAAVGIGAPGIPETSRPAIAAMPGRLHGIEGFDWRSLLAAGTQVVVLNDARAALWGEVWRGAAQGLQDVILLTLGTGVGGAVMVDGKMLGGHRNRASHLGHLSLNPYGPGDCVNTPGSLEDAIGDASLHVRSRGRFHATWEMLPFLQAGDAGAWQIWQRSIDHLAAGLASLINLFDPAKVLLGGGIAKAGDTLFIPLERALRPKEWTLLHHPPVPVIPAQLGSHAGAVGAAKAAWDAAGWGRESCL